MQYKEGKSFFGKVSCYYFTLNEWNKFNTRGNQILKEETIVKKSVSLREDIFQYALEQAENLHGGNYSAYITYLISNKKNNTDYITYNSGKKEIVLTRDRIETLLMYERHFLEIIETLQESITVIDKSHLTLKGSLLKIIINRHAIVKSMGLEKRYDISITL